MIKCIYIFLVGVVMCSMCAFAQGADLYPHPHEKDSQIPVLMTAPMMQHIIMREKQEVIDRVTHLSLIGKDIAPDDIQSIARCTNLEYLTVQSDVHTVFPKLDHLKKLSFVEICESPNIFGSLVLSGPLTHLMVLNTPFSAVVMMKESGSDSVQLGCVSDPLDLFYASTPFTCIKKEPIVVNADIFQCDDDWSRIRIMQESDVTFRFKSGGALAFSDYLNNLGLSPDAQIKCFMGIIPGDFLLTPETHVFTMRFQNIEECYHSNLERLIREKMLLTSDNPCSGEDFMARWLPSRQKSARVYTH